MSKTFWAIIAIIIVIFGAMIAFNKKDEANTGNTNAQPSNHIVGEGASGVKLVEYGDFECPACGQYYPLVEQIKEKYKTQIQFQFRHLPLIQIHQQALAASKAAEAAGKQGKFWEMYNLLYQNQQSWSGSSDATDVFEQYASQLGLNIEQYKADAASSGVNSTINADIAEFKKTKESMSTPTFFLEGERIVATSLEDFSKLIDEAIAKKAQESSSDSTP